LFPFVVLADYFFPALSLCPGTTWDELIDMSKKMTRNDGGKQFYGFARSPDHLIRMNPLSIPMADLKTDTPTINTDERKIANMKYRYGSRQFWCRGYLCRYGGT
jgi:ABC-type glycerol-3-phosphate transport system substrate-binding protein